MRDHESGSDCCTPAVLPRCLLQTGSISLSDAIRVTKITLKSDFKALSFLLNAIAGVPSVLAILLRGKAGGGPFLK